MKKRSNRTGGASPCTFTHGVLLLLCAVLVTAHLISGIYAAYVSNLQGGGSMQVASFSEVEIEDDSKNDLFLIPGKDGQKQCYVTFNGAQVSTYVFVVITVPSGDWQYSDYQLSAASGKITLGVSDGWEYLKFEDNRLVLYKSLGIEETLKEVEVFANSGTITVSKLTTAEELAAAEGNFNVQAAVVQSGGYSVAEAWASLSAKFTSKEGGSD